MNEWRISSAIETGVMFGAVAATSDMEQLCIAKAVEDCYRYGARIRVAASCAIAARIRVASGVSDSIHTTAPASSITFVASPLEPSAVRRSPIVLSLIHISEPTRL